MKVIAINGSPNNNGNTKSAINAVFSAIERQAIECETIDIGNRKIQGCIACGQCRKNKIPCVLGDEYFESARLKMVEADAIILASPVYFAGIAGTMKSFLDRAFYSSAADLRHKIGASIAVCRRSGGMTTFHQLNNFLLYNEFIVASSCYWNVAHGAAPGEITQDLEGMNILNSLGENIAWLVKMKNESKIESPEMPKKVRTSFVR